MAVVVIALAAFGVGGSIGAKTAQSMAAEQEFKHRYRFKASEDAKKSPPKYSITETVGGKLGFPEQQFVRTAWCSWETDRVGANPSALMLCDSFTAGDAPYERRNFAYIPAVYKHSGLGGNENILVVNDVLPLARQKVDEAHAQLKDRLPSSCSLHITPLGQTDDNDGGIEVDQVMYGIGYKCGDRCFTLKEMKDKLDASSK